MCNKAHDGVNTCRQVNIQIFSMNPALIITTTDIDLFLSLVLTAPAI